ncbi:hypothetical protein M422DRAFT_273503 [Sphaerobolus stellatus SS14]|uniref:Calpain catalytic domain-containing protein n=1 Tax=Sphaerobolus stellatus (strain SS14) TaxID=990650 RepID=A0A0C9T8Z5_SPHS4|nr:hypothetical protein M422DRAFT_273503 [Sphaerobolus stellatus SS14]
MAVAAILMGNLGSGRLRGAVEVACCCDAAPAEDGGCGAVAGGLGADGGDGLFGGGSVVGLSGTSEEVRVEVIDETLPFLEDGQLLGVSTGQNNILWPALLEKAYMRLMGGYDFPGSNSSADLQ